MSLQVLRDGNIGLRGNQIHKRFFTYKPVAEMSGLEWFSPVLGYGSDETYGPIIRSYTVLQEPLLLDLRKKAVRDGIEVALRTTLNADDIYSGGPGNKEFHTQLYRIYGKAYHGTYINDPTDDIEWDGAREIVLWRGFTELLREI
jgi:hypothetical protein